MPPDYVSTTDVSCDETPKRTKEHFALQNAAHSAESKKKTVGVEEEEKEQSQSRASVTAVTVSAGPGKILGKPKSRESIQRTTPNMEERSKSRPSTMGGIEDMNRLNSRASVTTTGGGKKSPAYQAKQRVSSTLESINTKNSRPSVTTQEHKKNPESKSKLKDATALEQKEPSYVIIKDGTTREKRGKVVTITGTQFVPQQVTIYSGECLNFQLENGNKGGELLIRNKVEQVLFLSRFFSPICFLSQTPFSISR